MIKESKHRIKLTETPFLRKIGELLGEIISRKSFVNLKTGRIEDYPDYVQTQVDEYIESVFKPAGNILNVYEQLEFIPVFISKFSEPEFHEDNGINHPKYIQYHIENHYMKIATIFDLSIILISEIYRLGIPPKLTSYQQLTENKITKNSKSIQIIKKFDKAIKGIKTIRNLIAHRGEFDDLELNKVHRYFFVSNPKTDEKPLFTKEALNSQMDELIDKKMELVNKNNLAVYKIIEDIFEESLTILEQKISELSNKNCR